MVRKRGILIVCLTISFLLIALALINFNFSNFSPTGKAIFDNTKEIKYNTDDSSVDNPENIPSNSDDSSLIKNKKSNSKKTITGYVSKDDETEKKVLKEYKPKQVNQEEIFLDKKFKDNGRYIISSLNEYSPEWYPSDSPKADLKKLIIELQVTDKVTGKNFSIKGTADIPKYYGGHFDFNTSLDDLVLFKDINPNFSWEYSEEYSILPIEKYQTSVIEEGKIKNKTFVEEKVFKNYQSLNNQIKQNIPKELFLDPDVSVCGSLGTAGATFDVTTPLTSTGTCLQITADNVTLDCHGYLITYSTSGTQNNHGIDIGVSGTATNATIKNCRVQDGYWTTSTSSNLYRVGIYSQYANYSKFINNTLNVSNGITFYFLWEKYLNLTENTAYGEYIGTTFDYVYNSTVLNHRATTYPSGSWGFRHERSVNNTLVNLNTTALNSNHALWFQNSTNTKFINLRTFSTSGYGIYIDISNNSVFKDCISINGGGSYDVAYNSLSGSANNTFLNCSYTLSKEYVTGTGNQLIRQWYYQAYVNDSVGSAVENANVTGRNSSSIVQFTAQTNSSGWITRQNVTEYINRAGTRTYGNNYSINGSKSGYTADVNSWNFTLQQNLINDVLTLTGGGVSCGTMTTPNTLYTLSGNITSTDTCFDIEAANVTIDCQGYWITYSTNGGNGEYGIYTEQHNTTVKNCNILDGYTSSNDNWRVGLILVGSNYSTLFNNTIRVHNSTAVYLEAIKSLNATLNIARSAEDNGFSFYYIWNSTFENNTGWSADEGGDGEGIVFEYATNNTVFRNNGTSTYRGIALTWSNNNNITNNWAQGGDHTDNAGLLLGYSSTNNTLINNTGISSGAGIFFWEYTDNNTLINNTGICTSEESAGLTFYTSSGNKVSGQKAMGLGTNADAIAIIDSSNTIIRDCVNLTSVANDFAVYGSNPANNNTVINCSYSTSKEYVQGSNIYQLIRKWYYQASANYTNGTLASGVNITAYNTTGRIQFTELTNSSGLISRKEIIEYNNSAGTRTFYNNYILNASLSGYSTITRPNYNLTVKQNNVTDFFTFTGTSGGDTTPPTITFESPTPSNTSSTSNPVTLVANISDASNTSSWIDLDRSLIGYWAMDYYNTTVVFDNSTYKNNATFNGGINYTNLTTGKRGQALRFNGTNQQLVVPDSPIYDFPVSGTVSIWVNQLTSIGDYDMPFWRGGSSVGVPGYDFELGLSDWYSELTNGTAASVCYYSATPLVGWNMLTFTFDTVTNHLTCYVNGTLIESIDITDFGGIDGSSPIYLGTDDSNNWDFNGSIDEVLIFNRSLSSTEVKALYSSQINKFNTSSMNLSNGQHNYTVYAIDEAGNTANSGWRYFIVSGGGSGISSCQNLNTANTIYTLTSNVSSTGTCFTIGASNITIDCNGYWINYSTGGGAGTYGVVSSYSNTTVRNCNILDGNWTGSSGNRYGIYFYTGGNNLLTNNSVNTSNSYSVYFDWSSNNNVTFNRFIANSTSGLYIYSSNNTNIINNNITSIFNVALWLYNVASNNYIKNNTITTSISTGNSGIILNGGSSNNTILNNSIISAVVGITSDDGVRLSIINNTISSNSSGALYIQDTNHTLVNGNTITSNFSSGISVSSGSYNDTIINNLVRSFGSYSLGMAIYISTVTGGNHNLTNNTAISNLSHGIYFNSASNCNLTGNNATSLSSPSGIYLFASNYTRLISNNATSISGSAISLNNNANFNILIGNTATGSTGIQCSLSNNTVLMNNTGNGTNMGISLITCFNSNVTNNTAIGSSQSGMYTSDGRNNTFLRNIATSTSSSGIYLNLAYNYNLTDNDGLSYGNQPGIFIDGSSNHNILLENNGTSLGGSGSNYGIWVTASHSNTFINNTGWSGSGYGMYFSSAYNNTLNANNGTSSSSSGIYLAISPNNTLISNTGTSSSSYGIALNLASNSTLTGNTGTSSSNMGLLIQSSSNLTLNSNIGISSTSYGMYLQSCLNITSVNQTARTTGTSGTRYGIYIYGSNHSVFRDCVNVSGGTADLYYDGTSLSINNTFINCSYSIAKESVNGASNSLIRKWYYMAYVNYSNGTLAYDANVTAYNITGQIQFTEQTNSSGWIQRKEVTDYINTGGTRTFWNNYTINASKVGYITDNNVWNFTIQQNMINDFFTLFVGELIPPIIIFEEPPTPINASSNSSSPVTIVANISDASNTSAWIDFDKNLVGYWAMDYYNATVIFDNSTYKNNATFNGGINYTNLISGKRGQALSFNGTNQQLIVPDSTIYDFITAGTVSIWVNQLTSVGDYDMPFFKGGSSAGVVGYDFELGGGDWYTSISNGTVSVGTNICYYSATPLTGWHMLTFTFDTATNKLICYIDGTNTSSGVDITGFGSIVSPYNIYLGGDELANNDFNGSIDEVLIFNRTLSSTEIKALYSSQINKFNSSQMNLSNGQYSYTVYAIDEYGNTANSGWRYFILGGSCVYISGNWNINCSESCTINTNYDVGNNNITINGTGTIIVSANITNYNKLHIEGVSPSNICTVRCVSGGCFND